ncbi:ATP-dependent helicase [Caldimonas thermodepolymerans]|uniref:ATP-dependent helicase n=1 Tax=Caldimonas thermodepolymerans TaxID=215580 RepID=UPI002235590F|nr:ATP-dependent helicase [Caldimonas thermodepolymerans]UZG43564.1 ATP-dependent helicase [Caldimonas thermodepolymerans]
MTTTLLEVPPLQAPDPFAALNAQQRDAVEHGIADGPGCAPLLVIAGAGSGKTMTLAARVARLVLAGADPQRLLLLTFSRRAAQEMERRVGRVLQQALGLAGAARPPALPWSGTFHSVGARLLRAYAARIGLPEDFTIHDRADAEDLMGWVREELGLARTKHRFPLKGTCLSIYSRVVNSQAPLAEVLQWHYPWCQAWEDELVRLFGAYVRAKQQQHVLDYDDLLLYWAEMVSVPELARELGARFDHVLVDEYQDTNRLQAAILQAMKPDGQGLTVVGDDAQSIYSFRAAEVRNILDFPRQFGREVRVVTLERNYRSTQPILDASNAVIALAAERHAKQLWTDRTSSERPALVTVLDDAAQARWVADEVLRLREQGLRLRSQAVLFRAAHHSAALELELARRNIPFVKFGGLKFLEASHIKDVLAVLRWVENPRNRLAGFRVAQLVPGIGPATARRLLDALEQAADPAAALLAFEVPAAARDDWQALRTLYAALRQGEAGWPDDLRRVQQWYQPHLERLHDDAPVRAADLAQLARIAEGYRSREQFLAELALDPPEATSAEAGPPLLDEDYLILSTIHSAKGQEWQAVYLLNAVDGCIPSDLATGSAELVEEERRLLYVAMTRARQHLQLIVPQRFYVHGQGKGDRHVYGSLSRFIPPQVQPLFERRQPAAAAAPEAVAPSGATVDLAARLRGRWG